MHVFYTPDILTKPELPEEEAQHCTRVLRLGIGDEITLTDGKGNFYRAEITAATNKRCLVKLIETIPQAPLWSGHLHIAMAPTKNMDRNEFDKFIAQDYPGQKFIAHCYEGEKPLLKDILEPGKDALVLIGPEGDFSEEEVKKAIGKGFRPISLGKSRLRTETAALVATMVINSD